MIKKLTILLITILLLIFSSCNPASPSWEKDPIGIHIYTADGQCNCIKITGWYEHSNGTLQVETEEYGELLLAKGTYIMYNTICPICNTKGSNKND